jgi:transcriptional regulator with XRE-family HTH domain
MRIREAIEEQGMTTKQVAEKLNVTLSALNQSISGNPSVKVITNIANAIGVPVWQLFASSEEVHPKSDSLSLTCPHCGKDISIKVE